MPRYFLASLPFLHLLMADGAAAVVHWRTMLGSLAVAIACAGVVLQGSHTLVSERKFEARPLADFIKQHHSPEAEKVVVLRAPYQRDDPSVNDLHLSGTLEYYLRPDIQVDYRRQAPINPKALAERLGARPAAWFVVRNAGKVNLQEELPPGAVGCEWIYRHLQVIVIARSRSDLPKDLQNCELHNGPL